MVQAPLVALLVLQGSLSLLMLQAPLVSHGTLPLLLLVLQGTLPLLLVLQGTSPLPLLMLKGTLPLLLLVL
jgi:hypothetical protein